MRYVFGPVPSRRLGLSLGVDLIPRKTCSFDCLYCEVGRTTHKTITPRAFYPVQEIICQIKESLKVSRPDFITLAGSGEPTLNSSIDSIIRSIKEITETPVAILTNGSLFWRDDIRAKVMEADVILPTLATGREGTFIQIHRPHPDLDLDKVTYGLERLREEYSGQIYLEVVVLEGQNDSKEELVSLKERIARVGPDRIQLNTVVRPPADSSAKPLDMEALEQIKTFLGQKAEIISSAISREKSTENDSKVDKLIEIIKRRPLREIDLVAALNLPHEQIRALVKGLLFKGIIRTYEHSGIVFYLINEENRPEEGN